MEPADKTLEQAAHEIIDQWIEDLIRRITSGDSSAPQRGLWDRFKGGLFNLFLGRQGKTAEKYNPYYLRNKFGDDLGVEESINLTLSDYANIKSAVFLTESKVADGVVVSEATYDKLKIVIMLRTAAKELKERLGPLLSKYSGVSVPAEPAAAETKPKDPDPAGVAPSTKPKDPDPAGVAPSTKPKDPDPAGAAPSTKPKDPDPAGVAPSTKPKVPAVAAKDSEVSAPTVKPVAPENDELSEESSMKKILSKMIQGKKTKEEILGAVEKGIIEGLLEKIDKGSIKRAKRFWGDYKTAASPNVEDLKDHVINHLANTILFISHRGKVETRFGGIDEKLLKTIALDSMK